MISFLLNMYLVFFRSGCPEVVSESDSLHTERRCVVASHCGPNHQQSRCKRLRPLVWICVYFNSLYCSDCYVSSYIMNNLLNLSRVCSLHKVLFTEQPETYYKWDNWPPESDRKWVFLQLFTYFLHTVIYHSGLTKLGFFPSLSFFLRLCSEVPLLEDTLMRILVIGLSRDLPLGPADAMELADHLVKRAAGVQSDGVCDDRHGL